VRKVLRTGVETGARLPCPKNRFALPQGGACLFLALFRPESGLHPYFRSKTPRKTSFLDKLTEPPCAFTLPKAHLLCPLTTTQLLGPILSLTLCPFSPRLLKEPASCLTPSTKYCRKGFDSLIHLRPYVRKRLLRGSAAGRANAKVGALFDLREKGKRQDHTFLQEADHESN
jgi:hypothetical protein